MGKYFAIDPITHEVDDIIVKRPMPNGHSVVMAGDKSIGLVSKGTYGWWACSHAQPPRLLGLRSFDGFHSRWSAIEYLLKVGFYLPENYCIPELDWHPVGYHGSMAPGKCWTSR